jgi:hypothetical protein
MANPRAWQEVTAAEVVERGVSVVAPRVTEAMVTTCRKLK